MFRAAAVNLCSLSTGETFKSPASSSRPILKSVPGTHASRSPLRSSSCRSAFSPASTPKKCSVFCSMHWNLPCVGVVVGDVVCVVLVVGVVVGVDSAQLPKEPSPPAYASSIWLSCSTTPAQPEASTVSRSPASQSSVDDAADPNANASIPTCRPAAAQSPPSDTTCRNSTPSLSRTAAAHETVLPAPSVHAAMRLLT